MSETPVRELPHFVLFFRCGCAMNMAIEGEVGRFDLAAPACRKHRKMRGVRVMDALVPGKIEHVEFHGPHQPKPVDVPVIYP